MLYLSACTNDIDYVSKHNWKYSDGAWISDWLNFEDNFLSIRNDTIFINDSAKAIIDKVEKRLFADNLLFVVDINNQEIGRYSMK